MPEVFADEDAGSPVMLRMTSEGHVERAEPIPCHDVALLVEEAVGREIDLAVRVDDIATADVERGVVEVMPLALQDQPGDDVDAALAGCVADRTDLRRVERQPHVGDL